MDQANDPLETYSGVLCTLGGSLARLRNALSSSGVPSRSGCFFTKRFARFAQNILKQGFMEGHISTEKGHIVVYPELQRDTVATTTAQHHSSQLRAERLFAWALGEATMVPYSSMSYSSFVRQQSYHYRMDPCNNLQV